MKRTCLWALAVLAGTACKKDGKSDSSNDGTQAGEVVIDTNPLATSYPDGLTLSAFQTTDDAGVATAGTVAISYDDAAASLRGASALQEPPPDGGQKACFETYADALAAQEARTPTALPPPPLPRASADAARDRINGKASDCFPSELKTNLEIVLLHAKETSAGLDGYGDCFLPDFGVVEGLYPDTSDACTVGYGRAEVRKLGAYVDFTKQLTEAMLCQALKDGALKAPLAAGESKVMTESLRKALGAADVTGMGIDAASITRAAAGETTSYLTKVQTTIEVVTPGGNKVPVPFTIEVAHAPTDDANTAYTGTVRVAHPMPSRGETPTSPAEVRSVKALSLAYAKTADATGTRLKYEMRSALMEKSKGPYGADGQVDFNAHGEDVGNEKIQRISYVTYDGYPELDVAKLSYWVNFGGGYGEAARGMVFDIKRVDGKVRGCAVAGATGIDAMSSLSVRRALKEGYYLFPTGNQRPFLCDNRGEEVWLQCFVRDEGGAFVVDEALTSDTGAGVDFIPLAEAAERVPELRQVPRPPSGERKAPPGAP